MPSDLRPLTPASSSPDDHWDLDLVPEAHWWDLQLRDVWHYLVRLGMNRERIATGYDVVDNAHFSAGAEKWRREPRAEGRGIEDSQTEQPIGRDTPQWHGQDAPAPLLSTLDVRPSTPFFLASNRFVERKNLARLIDAYAGYSRSIQYSVFSIQHQNPRSLSVESRVTWTCPRKRGVGFYLPAAGSRPKIQWWRDLRIATPFFSMAAAPASGSLVAQRGRFRLAAL